MEKAIFILVRNSFFFSLIIFSSPSLANELINIPLNQRSNWVEIKYNNISANKVEYQSNGITVSVENSSSALIYPLPKSYPVKKIIVTAKVEGQLNVPKEKIQGSTGFDDFVFRIGLIQPGKKTLTAWQKLIAPQWVLETLKFSPAETGVEYIEFLNIPNNRMLTGKQRIHPESDLIKETFLEPINDDGQININHVFTDPRNTFGVWLGIDGDDTNSKYQVLISKIELVTE